MTTVTHDARVSNTPRHTTSGLGLALVSAVAFGLSGALARPLLDAGWSASAVVLVRIALGAAAVAPFGIASLHGRWGLLRASLPTVLLYGVLAVAGAQYCYFSAVRTMDVGPALLIEYTAPVAVVGWLWLRRGHRPTTLTVVGAAVAVLGLLLVLDLFSGADVDLVGALWALAAMVGAASYFLISADDSTGLPPLALASGGLVVGGAVLGVLALVGALPMDASTSSISYADHDVAWWVPLVLLGLVTAALSYVSGIAASRLLGARLASFVALSEVIAAVLWAWVLLAQLPGLVQLLGGALVLAGVVAVRAGEPVVADDELEVP
jgi:drug/metabolite transporter (DMT)-like permease